MEFFRSRRSRRRKLIIGFMGLFAVAILARLLLAECWPGYYADQQIVIQWWQAADRYGLAGAYAHDKSFNYPPFYLLLMQIYAWVLKLFGLVPQAGELSYKGLLICIDLAALLTAVRLSSDMGATRRFLLLAVIALNPAMLTDGILWGQVDMLHSLLMVIAVVTVGKRPWLSGLFMAVALLTKFQAVTIVPVLAVYLASEAIRTRRWQPAAQWCAAFLAPWLATIVYFGVEGTLRTMLRQAYTDAVGMYSNASLNAMNVWYHLSGVSPSTSDTLKAANLVTYRQIGLALFGVVVLLVCGYVAAAAAKREQPVSAALLKASAAVNMAFFMLPTEIHERYAIPALLFLLFTVIYDRRWLVPAAALTATVFVNLAAVLHMIYGHAGSGQGTIGSDQGWFGDLFGLKTAIREFFASNGLWGSVVGAPLSAHFVWIAGVNLAVLILLLGLLWMDIHAAQAVRLYPERLRQY